ncbi:2-hydroxymuconic semialdehyde dehydrogenase [Microbacterium sp. YY-01]|uniref:2-hydroxymuconic semialdehyde dehydrogenase n=1 Tax=Microbacterium sp. YY-01 TaxID=3421634 RepID=UPI003D1869CA
MSTPQLRNLIDNEWVDSGQTFADVSPVTGATIAEVHEADRSVVDAAVGAARRALHGPWRSLSVPDRVAALRRFADGIRNRFDDLAAVEIADTGKPAALARSLDVPRAAVNIDAFADLLTQVDTESYITELADGSRALNYTVRKPLGVVAVIVPWNLPLLLLTWKLGPALACGNTVVIKPSELTPWSATVLGEIAVEAGIPPGVINIVHGFGPNSAGEYLTTHPDIDGVTFTGESSTGATIMSAVASGVKPVSFELGGKNAGIVFADADFDRAVAGIARSSFLNTGQVCLATERVYVERSIYERFVDALAVQARNHRLGHPDAAATTLGPLISHEHRNKVTHYFDRARAEGTIITGGGIPDMPDDLVGGSWIEPTIATDLAHDSAVMREEIFGPFCGIIPFDTEEEAIALANDTRYGLAAATWTDDLRRAHRVAAAMDVGISWVNTWYLRDLRTPFGGRGLSGIGREGGKHSLDFYTDSTNVVIAL